MQSDWAGLFANTTEGPAHKNKLLIIVSMETKGISKSTNFLTFEDVCVPAEYVIGFAYQMIQFQVR